ncbi:MULTISPECIES: alpha/beta hydrolase family protein [unclassified Streptomyces]|uniref:alpha/beta hydrolase family protein n=1 Tax=unclassified Streptomyces TaxID=2593676 RepID=UPI000DAE5EF5|nr:MULTISPECIES: alpha/beta hydrolase [unclassified Streptomyces]PZT71705.1 alpha/beta hydrolase [Streptomyces sp. AC1-42T]PZT73168.1 alpha/beta hydrolase [Streptomyces sp. AC1-42W]
MRTRRRGVAASFLVLALGAAAVTPAVAAPPTDVSRSATAASVTAPQLRLPAPSGPYGVGRSTLHLRDADRTDPYVPAAGARELLVSVFYPARPGSGAPAPYMSTREARLLLESRGLGGLVAPEVIGATETYARTGAKPVRGRFPLVVLSPGFGQSRFTLTALATDLAARGYVVAAVDHAHESTATVFPGGRVLPCAACDYVERTGEAGLAEVARGRAADVSFLLDRLTGRHPAWRYASMIDRRRVGMAGHSIGGDSAASTMAADRRVRAGVNMDGTFFDPVPATGLGGRPFMMLGTEADHASGGTFDTTWDRDWQRLDGWKRWLTVADAGHFTFTDLPLLAAELGIVDPSAPLPADRSGDITRDYVAAFFDLHLKGVPQRLLAGPTADNPEVTFQP